ncbi:flagellar hook protein FlgE [Vallicoccus soli]|uniref:Flagellar hook protein FlgE n=1 Tax=Vallicoccus soli TaxID=2339232 RepID=A0A3A3YQB7_9ACTN|nr:flagellar hook protein FlgE [Vallicoccus soli]RJK92811.1 flagellar hook protein FlgE [Vallicoccus soli]
MLRSLFSGISGLRSHQVMMDVTGNNIANVNTAGFKSSTTVFQDTLSQLVRAAGAPQEGIGGTNPAQIGLGVRVAGITTNFAQGSAQATGSATDLRIEGDGFFVVRKGNEDLFTRAGSFNFDTNGRLINPDGGLVMGWTARDGEINPNGPLGEIKLPVDTILPPKPTANAGLSGNLPADGAAGKPLFRSIEAYDDLGNKVELGFTFTQVDASTWSVQPNTGGPAFSMTFDERGRLTSEASTTVAANWGDITVDLSRITAFGGQTTIAATSQDGGAMGTLNSYTMAPDGTLMGVFSNGLKQALGQVALANFNNPPGLEKVGGSLYRSTVNSGVALVGEAGTGGRGLMTSGMLEMSNVDLAQEFTNLIVAQRGFQANSRVITSSDEMLQDLVNLKR